MSFQSSFDLAPLGDVARFINGDRSSNYPKGGDYVENGTPFISAADLGEGRVNYSSVRRISISAYERLRSGKIQKDDVLFCLRGSIGKIASIKEHEEGAIASSLVIVRATEKINPQYLFFGLSSQAGQQAALGLNNGAAQPNLSVGELQKIRLPLPPLTVQRRIAGILSAYDELIENNQRRIRILDEMARSLYREWFVHFRYPGHESVTLVDSPLGPIPQGWDATTLGVHLAALESGKRPKGGIRDVEDGVPSIGAENINGIGQHNFVGEKFVPREFFMGMRKGIVRDRDVAIYKDGAYIGKSSYFRDGFPHAECCINEHVFLLRANGVRLKQNALYLWLQESDTVHAIRATNANAAQPGINQQSVGCLELIVPDQETAEHFDRMVEPFLGEIISLAKKTENLRRTRDLLLPRLLSGQIEVVAVES